ncbi:MAG: hypothetical protein J6N78_00540 [Clostridia bacterium]|nr:hypothetical protein [Clostridia bacterium]
MEENNKNEINNSESIQESKHNFKTVPNTANKVKQPKVKKEKVKKQTSFGKNVLLPFFSGALGCAVVMGTILFVPGIKDSFFSNTTVISTSPSSSTNSDGNVKQVNLKNYSDTSVYAANKILPSICRNKSRLYCKF